MRGDGNDCSQANTKGFECWAPGNTFAGTTANPQLRLLVAEVPLAGGSFDLRSRRVYGLSGSGTSESLWKR